MKTFRKFCAALVLSAMLILPVFAGETQFPGAINSSEPIEQSEQCTAGETQFPGTINGCEIPTKGELTLDPATEMMLTLLESLLSLF